MTFNAREYLRCSQLLDMGRWPVNNQWVSFNWVKIRVLRSLTGSSVKSSERPSKIHKGEEV